MKFPEELLYTKSHEWVKTIGSKEVLIGLTDYAQHELGDLVFVNLPEKGTALSAGETCADVESVKAVSDIYSPVTGTVSDVNEMLLDDPGFINQSPYEAWLIRISDLSGHDELMDAAAYQAFVEQSQK